MQIVGCGKDGVRFKDGSTLDVSKFSTMEKAAADAAITEAFAAKADAGIVIYVRPDIDGICITQAGMPAAWPTEEAIDAVGRKE